MSHLDTDTGSTRRTPVLVRVLPMAAMGDSAEKPSSYPDIPGATFAVSGRHMCSTGTPNLTQI